MAIEKILVVDDEPMIRKSFEELLRPKRYGIATVGTLREAEKLLKRDTFDLLFLDVRLPDGEGTDLLDRLANLPNRPLTVVMSGFGTIDTAVTCMKGGAFDYLIKPYSLGQIEVIVKKAETYRQVLQVNEYLAAQISDASDLLGDSPAIVALRSILRKVAPTEATVLIQGENGTGKELVAHEIFHGSGRAQMPYIKVNCAAVSDALIESEFFGHEKGAFTGATERREGRFELANGGTLLLDEISEISPRLQAKLLRVLQEREFERVGGSKTIKVDVRVLATTNRDLKKAVAAGDFREDLYYRLNVFPVEVPALRDRQEDVPVLAAHFLDRLSRQHGLKIPGFTPYALDVLCEHAWPGNVRELQNTVERAVILTDEGALVSAESLGIFAGDPAMADRDIVTRDGIRSDARMPGREAFGGVRRMADVERDYILHSLEQNGGNRTRTAEMLDISIRTLRNKLNEYRIGKELVS